MRNYKIFLLSFVIFSFLIPSISKSANTCFQPGEVLIYDVSFLGINLGTIKLESIEIANLNGKKTYYAKSYINSNPGIPFVSLHSIFNSWMDPSLAYSYQFVGQTQLSDNLWDYNKIIFDYQNNQILNKHWYGDSLVTDDKFDYKGKINDGCSLLFFARQYVDLKKTVYVPTFIDGPYSTKLNFIGTRENIKIDAISYPVKTIYFDGKADWKGIYGLTGKFEGWFSDDEAHIPIKALMNVYVGKIVIELKSWERKGWNPPQAKSK